ncbi:hypothetical protein FFI94_033055 [Rhodococcus sp. KBS0724]|uniref:hypothetical protein n=1 Tax=Rhodococcus sp. KBS0724 TaxID=1179674 RepID=UPI001186B1EB|nr:hypothetical protein [Rhodococcus sp. KBS0724]TSD40516.1 hypothetical protein FFI94_033055 [Rhodococcus sp. KBS0724]
MGMIEKEPAHQNPADDRRKQKHVRTSRPVIATDQEGKYRYCTKNPQGDRNHHSSDFPDPRIRKCVGEYPRLDTALQRFAAIEVVRHSHEQLDVSADRRPFISIAEPCRDISADRGQYGHRNT